MQPPNKIFLVAEEKLLLWNPQFDTMTFLLKDTVECNSILEDKNIQQYMSFMTDITKERSQIPYYSHNKLN